MSDNVNEELAKIDEWLKLNEKFMLFYTPGKNVNIPNLHINSCKLS